MFRTKTSSFFLENLKIQWRFSKKSSRRILRKKGTPFLKNKRAKLTRMKKIYCLKSWLSLGSLFSTIKSALSTSSAFKERTKTEERREIIWRREEIKIWMSLIRAEWEISIMQKETLMMIAQSTTYLETNKIKKRWLWRSWKSSSKSQKSSFLMTSEIRMMRTPDAWLKNSEVDSMDKVVWVKMRSRSFCKRCS